MNDEQKTYLEELRKLNSATVNLGKQLHAITTKIYHFDLFLITALNRTANLNKAFIELSEAHNFISAAPLVRINIDTLLRLYAARLAKDGLNEFARKVILEGKKVSDLKSLEKNENGKLKNLSDNYLKKSLSKIVDYEWVEHVYNVGNSYVHLDSSIFFASRKIISEEQTFGFSIGFHDSFVPEDQKTGAAFWMLKITAGIINQAKLWMAEKAEQHGFDIEKLNNMEELNKNVIDAESTSLTDKGKYLISKGWVQVNNMIFTKEDIEIFFDNSNAIEIYLMEDKSKRLGDYYADKVGDLPTLLENIVEGKYQ